ncbi:hypothetical protein L861_22640 [Litchfieldella anticariensis FP35 = DSM 16096]|uniref:Uncharacterized protein n=1 Tax=Litchfieldella anticariensis (strain DSM 16096 / CECT 5854 / CIP 108499 / LMG 22089 / FP35) TaxID=1121939 RepID=S2LEB6_LITA3|nr:hypothetical protein [Halomonas anticariensis]EPC03111.1 hypothetical protein L861_22640 [Halomonas anticariensis FP35 = DSM 16096]
MKLMLCGAVISLLALLLLLAMVIRLIEPSMALAMLGYAGLLSGMLVAVLGATSKARQRR